MLMGMMRRRPRSSEMMKTHSGCRNELHSCFPNDTSRRSPQVSPHFVPHLKQRLTTPNPILAGRLAGCRSVDHASLPAAQLPAKPLLSDCSLVNGPQKETRKVNSASSEKHGEDSSRCVHPCIRRNKKNQRFAFLSDEVTSQRAQILRCCHRSMQSQMHVQGRIHR